jgi:UDPglucose 6-dehydrogenase
MAKRSVSVIGLGKLGAPMTACFSSRGYEVHAVDSNAEAVKKVNAGKAPVFEPGLDDLIQANQARIRATTNVGEAILNSEITFIIVPTPSQDDGGFSLRHVLSCCDEIGNTIKKIDRYHLIVLTSTVMPGSTGGAVQAALQSASGKTCGSDFGLCYSPEFIALGSVIRDFLNPDFILIGESDPQTGERLEQVYKEVCMNNPPIVRMNFVNAELTKLAVNTYITTKISFANMLARICERLPEANVDAVTSALGFDSRIGKKYLKGAIGYGGPCFPRDNAAFALLAKQLGAPAVLAEATDRSNREEIVHLKDLVRNRRSATGVVAILGLAYKPNTDVVEQSQGVLLAELLSADEIPVIVYDPVANHKGKKALGQRVRFAESLEECIAEAEVVVITTPWEEFRKLNFILSKNGHVPRTIVDCWRMLDQHPLQKEIEYVPLGIGGIRQETGRR